MEEYKVDTIKYRGFDINIYQDIHFQDSPDEWGDESVFLVGFHRDFDVRREGFESGVCAYLLGGDNYDESDIERAKEVKKEYHCFGLEAYIHSGVHLSLSYEGNYPDRRWDVSQLGVVFIKREKGLTRKKAEKRARDLISCWNDCLSGNVYGFVAEKDGESFDSCWGFIGDYEDNGMVEDAKQSIDYTIEIETKKQLRKLRSYILNEVPLEKRFV